MSWISNALMTFWPKQTVYYKRDDPKVNSRCYKIVNNGRKVTKFRALRYPSIICPKIYIDSHFAKILDIYVYLRVQTTFVQKYKKKIQNSPLKHPLSLIKFQYTAKNCYIYWDFVLQQTRMITLKNCGGTPNDFQMEKKL